MKSVFIRSKRSGFTFIELIVVIAIIAIMAMTMIPFLQNRDLDQNRQTFVASLNSFVLSAQYNAIVSGKTNRVLFDLVNSRFMIEQATLKKDQFGQDAYEPVKIAYNNDFFDVDQAKFKIRAILINNQDALLLNESGSDKVWFYITSDGIAQNVTIKFADVLENEKFSDHSEQPNDYSLILNPFSAQFNLYESISKS
jgi:prepilin-type N-terminal cleavage/methylation domain-containing protein